MNNKSIIIIIVLYLNSTLISMEIAPKHNLIQLLQQCDHNDVKQEIINHIKSKQWWYLSLIFEDVRSLCFDSIRFKTSSDKVFAKPSINHKVHVFDITNKKIVSFQHSALVCSTSLNQSGSLLVTKTYNGTACMFARYDNYTLEQLLFKKALLTWLLVEKPNKKIDTLDSLIKDVALKCAIPYEELSNIYSTFPKTMQNSIWRTMHYKIQKYGKDCGSVCIMQ